jgi:hypothetical protein
LAAGWNGWQVGLRQRQRTKQDHKEQQKTHQTILPQPKM